MEVRETSCSEEETSMQNGKKWVCSSPLGALESKEKTKKKHQPLEGNLHTSMELEEGRGSFWGFSPEKPGLTEPRFLLLGNRQQGE